jgi:DNA replication protein DnaC
MDAIKNILETSTGSSVVDKTCEIHGDYVSNVFSLPLSEAPIETVCPKCLEERKLKAQEVEAANIFRTRHAKIGRSFVGGGLPPRFIDKDFVGYETKSDKSNTALKTCQKYADNFENRAKVGGGMIFCGKAGTGKTHLASAIINQVFKARHVSVFMSALGATRHVKATYSKDSKKSESQAINDFLRPDLLVIDEVGVQFGTDAEKVILFEIINQRYQDVKPTILISNLTLIELSDYIGERVVDRMYEGGGAVLSFDWDSYRRAGR